MGYHHCPIEPSDWSDGPDDSDICDECDSGIVNRDEMTIEGILYPAIFSERCEKCGGLGYIEREYDYEG